MLTVVVVVVVAVAVVVAAAGVVTKMQWCMIGKHNAHKTFARHI